MVAAVLAVIPKELNILANLSDTSGVSVSTAGRIAGVITGLFGGVKMLVDGTGLAITTTEAGFCGDKKFFMPLKAFSKKDPILLKKLPDGGGAIFEDTADKLVPEYNTGPVLGLLGAKLVVLKTVGAFVNKEGLGGAASCFFGLATFVFMLPRKIEPIKLIFILLFYYFLIIGNLCLFI